MKEPLSVRTAEFVDPEKATLYKYASSAPAASEHLPAISAGPFRPITLSLATENVRPRLRLGAD